MRDAPRDPSRSTAGTRQLTAGAALTALVPGLLLVSTGCKATLPSTSSEQALGATYIPLSPKRVDVEAEAPPTPTEILNALPNLTMRISTRAVEQNSKVSFAAGTIGQEGNSYTVVVDYLLYTTAYLPTCYERFGGGGRPDTEDMTKISTRYGSVQEGDYPDARDAPTSRSRVKGSPSPALRFAMRQRIPVYLGVGMRIEANLRVLKGQVQLSLFGLGAAAAAGNVSGSLVFQTLGISGESISALIPLPSDLSQASIVSAMQALAAIKAKLYGDESVRIELQTVGYEAIYRSANAVRLIDGTLAGSTANTRFREGRFEPAVLGGADPPCATFESR